ELAHRELPDSRGADFVWQSTDYADSKYLCSLCIKDELGLTLMLKVENLSKEYSTPAGSLRIVSDVSLTLPPDSAVSIMGASGSGKSTLLYMLGALEPPSSGTFTLNGQNPFLLNTRQLAAFRNKEIGFVFQD